MRVEVVATHRSEKLMNLNRKTKTTMFGNLKVFLYLCSVKQRQRENY